MLVTRLLLSEVTLPASHPRAGQPCPVYGFVVDHPRGPVLVDTGVGMSHSWVDEPFAPVGREPLPAGVAMVINSHLHFDHCGQNPRFPGVPLVAQTSEYEAALRPGHTVPEWVDFPGVRWELVDGPAEVLPGISVLPTSGHTVGHQSVVITDAAGPVIIAAQAVYDRDELEAAASVEPLAPDEAAATTASALAIRALEPSRVLFSHDPREWTPAPPSGFPAP